MRDSFIALRKSFNVIGNVQTTQYSTIIEDIQPAIKVAIAEAFDVDSDVRANFTVALTVDEEILLIVDEQVMEIIPFRRELL